MGHTFNGSNGLTYLWEEGQDWITEIESGMIYDLTAPNKGAVLRFLATL